MGAGRNYEEALLGGLLELCERDSLMIMWLLKLTPNIFIKNSLPLKIQNRIKKIEALAHGEITLFDISFDKKIPHICAFFRYNNPENELIHIGASAHFSLNDAIYKALDEVLANLLYGEHKISKILDFSDIKSLSDHRFFYSQNGNKKFLDFLFIGNAFVTYTELHSSFKESISIGEFL